MASDTEFMKIKIALAYQRELDCITDKPIGTGAFGQVVEANCRNEGTTFAIKVLPFGDEEMKNQRREIEALASLKLSEESKRNIIQYFKTFIIKVGDKQKLCIQMELCSISLEKFIYENKIGGREIIKAKTSPRFYQQVFRQILNGLAVIHSMRWVHRDIHPGNILVVNQNPQRISDIHVKIADFGLARRIGIELELVGRTIFSKLEKVSQFTSNCIFRAPELLATDTYDFKVDVYSAGLVLYFISHYLEDTKKWQAEICNLKEHKIDVKERLYHNDDKKLIGLINNLLQDDPHERLSAQDAKEYMFPTQDVQKNLTDVRTSHEFLARKENEERYSQCVLKELTIAAMRIQVERGTRVISERQILEQERTVNDTKIRIKIEEDEDVKNIFNIAAREKRVVVVVVIEVEEEVDHVDTGISSGEVVPMRFST